MRRAVPLVLLLATACAAPRGVPVPAAPTVIDALVSVAATRETEPTLDNNAAQVLLWQHPSDAALSRIIGVDEERGLEIYDLKGARLADHPIGSIEAVDLRYGLLVAGARRDVLAVALGGELRLLDAGSQLLEAFGRAQLPFAAELLCLHRAPLGGAFYVFAISQSGRVAQLQIVQDGAGASLRPVRSFEVGGEVQACAVDDARGALFLAEAGVALWRYATDPEAPETRALLDVAAPLGTLSPATKGLVLMQSGERRLLLAGDEQTSQYTVYDLDAAARLGSLALGEGAGVDAVQGGEGLAVVDAPLPGFPNGLLLARDEDNGGAARNFKLVDRGALLGALKLAATPGDSPRALPPTTLAAVQPEAETAPVADDGDAADDPAIWVHPRDRRKSLIIGSQKQHGLLVYDLAGQLVQDLPIGRINNVDVRDGFRLGGATVSLVAGSNRSDDSISLHAIDPVTGLLRDVADGPQLTGFTDVYGLCLFASRRGGHYVFATDKSGVVRQWRLAAQANGRVRIEPVRDLRLETQPEGCVADDALGSLFVGEEDRGLWRFDAQADGAAQGQLVDRVGAGGQLVADVEGVALWSGEGAAGYLVVSSQGEDAYNLYERAAPHAFRGKFKIVASERLGIDGASETDGLDVTSANLGGAYARGLLVVQDGRNVSPPENQNFKLVPWRAVEALLQPAP